MKSKDTINNYLLSSLFILMLIIPNLVLIVNVKNQTAPEFQSDSENSFTTLNKLKNYYSENFGFKTTLANKYLNIKSNVLKETPLPEKVVFGKENWFFIGDYYQNTLNQAFGNSDISDSMFEEISNKLKQTNNYLTEKNIKFYVVIAPNKNNIYKEYLPYQFEYNKTALQLLETYLAKHNPNLRFINLTETLQKQKHNNTLYIKTDSHWNDLGAFYGYRAIVEEIKKDVNINTVELKDYKISEEISTEFDITRQINYPIKDTKITLTKIEKSKTKAIQPEENIYRHYVNPENDKTLILHRDSYANALTQFINESFGESYYLTGYDLNIDLIEKTKPDVVIFELIERDIINWSQKNNILKLNEKRH